MRRNRLKTLIFTDIHANLEALEAILLSGERLNVDRYVCLGDVVGYYADPEACVKLIREMGVICIQGNHDGVASGLEKPLDFNPMAAEAILWTQNKLSAESRMWLAELPVRVGFDNDFYGVHGSIRDRDEYLLSRYSIEANFEEIEKRDMPNIVFFGHTHRRVVYSKGQDIMQVEFNDVLQLRDERPYLINPGGAGQPRDGTIGAPFAVLEGHSLMFHVADYDIDRTAKKVLKLPFGDLLARRLHEGV